jgi:hypothetical protein
VVSSFWAGYIGYNLVKFIPKDMDKMRYYREHVWKNIGNLGNFMGDTDMTLWEQ